VPYRVAAGTAVRRREEPSRVIEIVWALATAIVALQRDSPGSHNEATSQPLELEEGVVHCGQDALGGEKVPGIGNLQVPHIPFDEADLDI
jgi:hypothetical protein